LYSFNIRSVLRGSDWWSVAKHRDDIAITRTGTKSSEVGTQYTFFALVLYFRVKLLL